MPSSRLGPWLVRSRTPRAGRRHRAGPGDRRASYRQHIRCTCGSTERIGRRGWPGSGSSCRTRNQDADRPPFTAGDMLACCDGARRAVPKQPQRQLEAVRLLQIGLGDVRVKQGGDEVYTGYRGNAADQCATPRSARRSPATWPRCFPAPTPNLEPRTSPAIGHAGGRRPATASRQSPGNGPPRVRSKTTFTI